MAIALNEADRPLGTENMNKLKGAEFNVHWFLLRSTMYKNSKYKTK
jgi:hypothetical protein